MVFQNESKQFEVQDFLDEANVDFLYLFKSMISNFTDHFGEYLELFAFMYGSIRRFDEKFRSFVCLLTENQNLSIICLNNSTKEKVNKSNSYRDP